MSALLISLAVITLRVKLVLTSCSIIGIPQTAVMQGSIAIVKMASHWQVDVSCRCDIHQSQWTLFNVANEQYDTVTLPQLCLLNGSPCVSGDTFLPEKLPNKYIHVNYTGLLEQTTLLLCTNRVISSEEERTEGILLLIESQQSTLTPSSTTVRFSSTSVTVPHPSSSYNTNPTSVGKSTSITHTEVICPTLSDINTSTGRPSASPTSLQKNPATGKMPEQLGIHGIALVCITMVLLVLVVGLFGLLIYIQTKSKRQSRKQSSPIMKQYS